MTKKQNKEKQSQKKNKTNYKNYICPSCLKPKKALLLDNGYTICAYCGLVVYKIPFTNEKIDAPGFIVPDGSTKKETKKEMKKSMKKHHNIHLIKQFIKKHK